MPQWRKLHHKITESEDVQEMPDDFHRLLWSWLPLGLDREGRGIYNPAWIKSKIMPLRTDVSTEMVSAAMEWYRGRDMVIVYPCKGREYFYVPTFHEYQGDTKREAASTLPAPPHEASTPNSRPTHELGVSGSSTDVDSDSEVDADVDIDQDDSLGGDLGKIQSAFITASKLPMFGMSEKLTQAYRDLAAMNPTAEDIDAVIKQVRDKFGMSAVTGPWSIVNPMRIYLAGKSGTTDQKPPERTPIEVWR